MATDKPRLTIMFEREQYDVITRLAALQGRSASSMVRELIEAFTPVLGRLTDVLEAAAAAEADVRTNLARVADEQELLLMPKLNEAVQFFDAAMGALSATVGLVHDKAASVEQGQASEGGAAAVARSAGDPRLVTRGSGDPRGESTTADIDAKERG